MAPTEDVKGEGFEVVGHQPPVDEGKDEPSAEGKEKAEKPTAGTPSEGETTTPPEQELRPLDVHAVLRVCIGQLSAAAWQLMGLQPDPFTNTIRKDIPQARIAIDAASTLMDKLLPNLEGQEARDYQSLLTDLRLNFLKQSGEGPKSE